MLTVEQYEAWSRTKIAEWRREVEVVNKKWQAILRAGPEANEGGAEAGTRRNDTEGHKVGDSRGNVPKKKRLLPGKQNTIAALAARDAGGKISIDKVAAAFERDGVKFSGELATAASNALRYLVTLGFAHCAEPSARNGIYELTDDGYKAIREYEAKFGTGQAAPPESE